MVLNVLDHPTVLGILGVTWGWDPVPRYQLVGKHFRDEETIAAAKTIDSILKA